MSLKGRVAIVTGAARGIGLAAAERLAAEGAAVLMVDCDIEEASRASSRLAANGLAVHPQKADVSNRADVEEMVRAGRQQLGEIDILVNNAGIAGRAAPLEEVTDQDWDRMMDVDLKSVYLCSQAVIAGMKSRHSGRIINVASIAGKEGNPNMIPYSTAKAGVIGLTKALAKEVALYGIHVNAIAPAVINTAILQQLTPEQVEYLVQRIPIGRVGKPEEVAALILWLASDEASFTTGQCIDISGGRATY